jgi:hypothetical protein
MSMIPASDRHFDGLSVHKKLEVNMKIKLILFWLITLSVLLFAQTSPYGVKLEYPNGSAYTGKDVDLYYAGAGKAYDLTEVNPGRYEHTAIAHGEYDLYVDGVNKKTFWVGGEKVSDITDRFDSNNQLQTAGYKDSSITRPKLSFTLNTIAGTYAPDDVTLEFAINGADTSIQITQEYLADSVAVRIKDSLDASIDDASIERTNGRYNVKALGITNAMLASGIDIAKIATAFGDKPVRFFGGVVRQDSPGSGWYFVGGAHTDMGGAMTVTTSGTPAALVINFGVTIDSVIAFVGGPDTDFSRIGITTGMGVGLDNVSVKFFTRAAIGGQLRYTTEWLWFPDSTNEFISIDTTGFLDNWASGQELTFQFSPEIAYAGDVVHNYLISANTYPGGGNFVPLIRAVNRETFISWVNWSGVEIDTFNTGMRCTWFRDLGTVQLSADSVSSATGNVWFIGTVRDD